MDDVTTLVSGIDFKVRKLIAQQRKLRDEKENLIIELNQQKQTNEEQKQVIKGFEEKIRILKLAKMTDGKEDNSDVRTRINELVREIDKCIGLLNT
jgi:cell division protein FtsL